MIQAAQHDRIHAEGDGARPGAFSFSLQPGFGRQRLLEPHTGAGFDWTDDQL